MKPHGPINPLPVAERPWSSITWDSIGPLPRSDGYDAILDIVDRFTKVSHFVPAHMTDDSRALAKHFLQHVVRLHGYPDTIVSDRGATFSSAWWRHFCELSGTRIALSTAFHPQTEGQTERTNQTVEHHLRCYVDHLQSDWSDKLAMAEFAYVQQRPSRVYRHESLPCSVWRECAVSITTSPGPCYSPRCRQTLGPDIGLPRPCSTVPISGSHSNGGNGVKADFSCPSNRI